MAGQPEEKAGASRRQEARRKDKQAISTFSAFVRSARNLFGEQKNGMVGAAGEKREFRSSTAKTKAASVIRQTLRENSRTALAELSAPSSPKVKICEP